jgi:hypothetical protein
VLTAVLACKVNVDVNQPVAIEVTLPDSARVEVTDTFRPTGRALNGFGDSVQAALRWASFDTATLVVLDSTTGVSLSKAIGSARLQAHTEGGGLFSNTQTITVLTKLDSIRVVGITRDTVTAPDSLSDSLQVQVYALGGVIAGGRRVSFQATVFPAADSASTLLSDSVVLTSQITGVAAVRLRLSAGSPPLPDSVVVTATMRHVYRTPVDGSPLTFVVEFKP